MTILRSEIVEQAIDRSAGRFGRFVKEVVLARGPVPLSLVRKRSADPTLGDRATVLLIHGYGQNRYAWHLPSRSFANHLAAAGYDVFNLDLRGQGRSRKFGGRRPERLSEYVEEDLPRAFEEVRRTTGRDDLYVVGHSLGGLLTYAAAPLASALVRGIVTIGSPYQFTRGSGVLRVLAGLLWTLDRAGLTVGNLGNVPLPLRMIGATLRAARLYVESPLYPLRLRGWHAGAIEPEILAEHMRLAFDVANLPVMLTMFRWSTSGGGLFGGTHETGESYAERFERCALPLLVIAGTEDDLAPPASVEPAYLRSRSPDKAYRELPLGHIDLLVGRDAPRSTWPMVERWVSERVSRLAGERERPAATGWAGQEDLP